MVGRTDEQARLTALIEAARAGRSGALLLHGPPGIGKTELLRFAESSAKGFVVLTAGGMESESGNPLAGLVSLLARACDDGPVLAIVVAAHWLYEPSLEAFLFAGRRLAAEGVAMLG